MTHSTDPINSTADTPATVDDLAAVIQEFEQYRERLLNDTLTAAKRAKVPTIKVMAQIEPELAKLDTVIQGLRDRQTALINLQ